MSSVSELYSIYNQHPIICTDTRIIKKNAIFFCLKGSNFDGNTFAKQALEQGCSYVVVDDPAVVIDSRYFLVSDVLTSLQELAIHHRQQLKIPVIGITGSNGKTTTKELLASVLKQQYKILYTQGNLNNHIGVPLTLLQITADIEIAIIEMGANHQGEIAQLCGFAQPTLGLITNVGKAHLEGFGSFEGVKKTKKELYDYISLNEGIIFYNVDNAHLVEMAVNNKYFKQYSFKNSDAYCYGKIAGLNPCLSVAWSSKEGEILAQSHLVGAYNTENILAAVSIGRFFNISEKLIKKGIEEYIPQNNRSQVILKNGNTIIMDAYNANPSSMELAINNLSSMDAPRKLAILGDMLELADYSVAEHKAVIQKLLDTGINEAILVGNQFRKVFEEMQTPFRCFNSVNEAAEWLKLNPVNNSLILIKGSRGIKLEMLTEVL